MANVLGQLLLKLAVQSEEWSVGLDKAGAALAKHTAETKRWGAMVEKEFSKAANSIGNVSAAFGAFGQTGIILQQAISRTGEAIGLVTKKFAELGPRIGVVIGGLAGAATAFASAGVGVLALTARTAEHAAKMYQQAQAAGVSLEALTRLGVAAKMTGVDQETLVKSLEKMDKSALRAAQSGAYSSTAWGRLGINVKDASGHLKTSDALVAEVAGKFEKMRDGVAKSALAMELFGRGGAAMVPMLNQGGRALKEWGKLADDLGITLSTKTGRAAEEFHQKLELLGLAGQGMANHMMKEALPSLNLLTNFLINATNGGKAFIGIGDALVTAAKAIAKVFIEGGYATQYWSIQLSKLRNEFEKNALKTKQSQLGFLEEPGSRASKANEVALAGLEAKGTELSKALARIEYDRAEALGNLDQPIHVTPLPKLPKLSEGALTADKESMLPLPEKDVLADFLAKTRATMEAEYRLANAAGQTAAELLKAKAAKDADIALERVRLSIADRLTSVGAKQAEAARVGHKDEAQALDRNILQLEAQLDLLNRSTPLVREMFVATAADKYFAAVRKGLEDQIENTEQALKAQRDLTAAYLQGGAAYRAAQIEAKLAPDKARIEEARQLGKNVQPLVDALNRHRVQLEQEQKLTPAMEAAKLGRAGLSEKLDELRQQRAATNDPLARLAIDAKIRDTQRQFDQVWNDSAIKAGTFGEKMQGVFNELIQEGDHFGEEVARAFKSAVDGIESSIARFVVTGKGGFTQVIVGAEEAIVKAGLHSAVSAVLKATPLGKYFTKADGSSGNPFHVIVDSGLAGLPLPGLGRVGGSGGSDAIKGAAKLSGGLLGVGTSTLGAVANQYDKVSKAAAKAGMAEIWASLAWIPIAGPALAAGFGAIMLGQMGVAEFMEHGGDATPGQAYIVGEKRPELFIPGVAGHVYPHVPSGGDQQPVQPITVVYGPQVTTIDAKGLDETFQEHSRVLAKHFEQHIRRQNR